MITASSLQTSHTAITTANMRISKHSYPLFGALALYRSVAGATNESQDDAPTFQLGNDTAFNFEYLVALQNSLSGGSDIGPVLGAVKNIKPGDMESYFEEFYQLANDTKAQASDPQNSFDPINVRDSWFSTSHYYRRADVYIHRDWNDPLIKTVWDEQTAAFDKAIAALPIPGKRIQIPAPDSDLTVEAIWYAASEDPNAKLPTMIVGNGFDAAQEDSYHYYCAPALARGWNCITYEGPGQNTVRRTQDVGFIPEWERVVTPVVNYVLSAKSQVVDAGRLVLVGNSFGGYLAARAAAGRGRPDGASPAREPREPDRAARAPSSRPGRPCDRPRGRAAAFEPRLSAVILVGGVWDLYSGFSSQLSSDLLEIYEAGNFTQFDDTVLSLRDAGSLPTQAAWGLDYGLWAFKTHSPSEFFDLAKSYNIGDVVDRIEMPVFVGDAEFEGIFPGQPRKVADALGERGTLHVFEGVAGYHCQTGAQQELARTIFAWLNKVL